MKIHTCYMKTINEVHIHVDRSMYVLYISNAYAQDGYAQNHAHNMEEYMNDPAKQIPNEMQQIRILVQMPNQN